MLESNARAYWRRTKELMLTMLGLWMAVSLGLPMWVAPLNELTIPYIDLPLGFFMTSQGALMAFLLMLHVFARRQERIDRDHFSDLC
jgi:putative solute:sodium symporter small subunit